MHNIKVEYNKFAFDYTGNDLFKLFSDNSRIYLSLHITDTWQWRTGSFDATVYYTNDGTLDIFTSTCETAGSLPYCEARFMCSYINDEVYFTWGHKVCWAARRL